MNLYSLVRRSLFLLLVILGVACDSDAEWMFKSVESERYSFTRFVESIEEFPYLADPSKLSRVRDGFKRLTLNMSKDVVRKILGEPDFEMLHYGFKTKSEELIYSSWSYFLRRFERDLANEEFDQALVLHFKPSGELYWGDPGNIPGLEPLGAPSLHPESMVTIRN